VSRSHTPGSRGHSAHACCVSCPTCVPCACHSACGLQALGMGGRSANTPHPCVFRVCWCAAWPSAAQCTGSSFSCHYVLPSRHATGAACLLPWRACRGGVVKHRDCTRGRHNVRAPLPAASSRTALEDTRACWAHGCSLACALFRFLPSCGCHAGSPHRDLMRHTYKHPAPLRCLPGSMHNTSI